MSNNTLIAVIVVSAIAAIVLDRFLFAMAMRPRKQAQQNMTRPYTVPASEKVTKENPTIPSAPPNHGWPQATEE
jgi:hypothetical protein